jgi:ABC-type multidrug transport system fused ATPase/permease subunit
MRLIAKQARLSLTSLLSPISHSHALSAGVRGTDGSKGLSVRRLMMLYSEDKAVIVTGALLALVASPVEVVQFIYVSLALDDAATDGEKASFSGSIGMLCILYAIAAAAVTLNLMLLQSVGHRVAARVRRSLVASVLRQEVSFLSGHSDDLLQQTLGSDVDCIRRAVSSQLARWIQACVQVRRILLSFSPR